LCGSQPATERVLVDVVREQPLAVELDDGQELAVAGLEVGVAGDVDLDELELQLAPERDELLARPLAEVAALGAVETNAGYG
jgi:hypothetical protein